MFGDNVVQFTAEDAAGRVTLPAAMRKWLVITRRFPAAKRWAKTILARWSILRRNGRWVLSLYE